MKGFIPSGNVRGSDRRAIVPRDATSADARFKRRRAAAASQKAHRRGWAGRAQRCTRCKQAGSGTTIASALLASAFKAGSGPASVNAPGFRDGIPKHGSPAASSELRMDEPGLEVGRNTRAALALRSRQMRVDLWRATLAMSALSVESRRDRNVLKDHAGSEAQQDNRAQCAGRDRSGL